MLTLPGGSKLFTFDGAYGGVIAQYQTQQGLIRARLQAMYDAKQRALGLVFQCGFPMPGQARGASDGLTLPSDDYSWFANTADLIASAREIGFEFVAPEFVYVEGDDAMRNWPEFDSAAAARIWNMLANFRDKVMRPCGLPFRIDLAGELPTKPGVNITLAQYLWTNYTASVWPQGVPCQDATISIPCASSAVPLLALAFCGNPPDTLDVHVYDGGNDFPDATAAIVGMRKALGAAGLALPWDIGETQFNNAATAAATAAGIIQTGQIVRRVYQWQTAAGADGPISIADASPYNEWAALGF